MSIVHRVCSCVLFLSVAGLAAAPAEAQPWGPPVLPMPRVGPPWQPLPWPPNVVGLCRDAEKQFDYALLQDLTLRVGPFQVIQTHQDASGWGFLVIPAADARLRYWVTWDMAIVRMYPDGGTEQVGECVIDKRFINQFRPSLHQPLPSVGLGMNFDGGRFNHDAQIPAGLLPDGTTFVAAMLPTKDVAKACYETAGSDRDRFLDCVARRSMGSETEHAYNCLRETERQQGSQADLGMCLFAKNLGANEQQALAQMQTCYRAHQADWAKYPICMAEQRTSDKKTLRMLQCARDNFQQGREPSYWGMAACYFGPELLGPLKPNAETMIAVECAMQSSGEPMAFVGCAGGRLTARELQKCIDDGIGEDGCFGEGNTLTKAYDRVGQALAERYGDQSAIYQAWRAASASSNPREAVRVLNDVAREVEKAGKNVEREVRDGFGKIGEAAADVVPQITVGKPKGEFFGKEWSL